MTTKLFLLCFNTFHPGKPIITQTLSQTVFSTNDDTFQAEKADSKHISNHPRYGEHSEIVRFRLLFLG